MSVTINSRIVDLEELLPGPIDTSLEDDNVELLIPWIFRQPDTDIADEDNVLTWPEEESQFSYLFDDLPSYCAQIKARAGDVGLTDIFRESETITLPQESRKGSKKQHGVSFLRVQGMMLRILLRTVYFSIKGVRRQGVEIHFTSSRFDLSYVIGGKKCKARVEGAVTIGPRAECLPIVSFTGYVQGQTWADFLEETLSIMLGQLARNLKGSQDQEVFVVGFHGVQRDGCSHDEKFELCFSRGYHLCLKTDWLEATRALTRLVLYKPV